MLTQKQWKIQHLAERMGNIAISAGAEAARRAAERQSMVREHGIVADELRMLAGRMMEMVEQNIFGKLDNGSFDTAMRDLLNRSTFLALNAALVACKALEHKPMSLFAEEVRSISLELGALYGQAQQYRDIPAVSKKSRVVNDIFFLFRAISGRYTWCENARFVNEILFYSPGLIQNNRLIVKNEWRDMDMPFIKLGDVTENAGVVIISNDRDSGRRYAVLAEVTVNVLANSHVGVCQPSASDIPVRECWLASDGSEMIFPDWEKIAQ